MQVAEIFSLNTRIFNPLLRRNTKLSEKTFMVWNDMIKVQYKFTCISSRGSVIYMKFKKKNKVWLSYKNL